MPGSTHYIFHLHINIIYQGLPKESKYYLQISIIFLCLRKNTTPANETSFKGSIEEELYDVLYYTLAIANLYDIDLESWIPVKERINDEKYGTQNADKLFSN